MPGSLNDHAAPGYLFRLDEPEVEGQTVRFSWRVTPRTDLYHRTYFGITFPREIEVGKILPDLWWRVALLCLHTHWALLRPCRVELPVALDPAEQEFWLRLTRNVATQLDAYGGPLKRGGVELVGQGPRLPLPPPAPHSDRAAVCFSGGKDSLVLTGLLSELTDRPLLVTATSAVPWAPDHVGVARERALTQVSARLGLEVVEVRSDYRTSWDHGFRAREGWWHGVHELSDLLLYHAVAWAVAVATGTGRVLMASEADTQYNAERDGTVILHPEFLSCAVTQGALDALFRRFGVRQGSLSYPVHMPQVQALLLRRYGHLADLQFSCWQAPEGEQACSACGKCFQIAIVTLSEGVPPSAVGIDLVHALCTFADWTLSAPASTGRPPLHPRRSSRDHVVRCLQQVSTDRAAAILAEDERARSNPRLGEALAIYARLRAEALARAAPPRFGYVGPFLNLVPADLRARLRAILDHYFDPVSDSELEAITNRARALRHWISEPLDRASPAAAASPSGRRWRSPGRLR